MSVLDTSNPISNYGDSRQTLLQPGRYKRLDVCFLLEDKARKKCDHLPRFIVGECVLKDKLSKNKFIDRVDLMYTAGGQYYISYRAEKEAPRKPLAP